MLPLLGNAQSWAPRGAKLTFGVSYAFSPATDYRVWIAENDTVIQGRTCRVIQRYGNDVEVDYSDKFISYEDSNIVYWYIGNQFTVLYDFNKVAGQSWIIHLNNCSLSVQVTATGMDTINGLARKTLTLSGGSAIFGKIIQGIGSTQGPMPMMQLVCGQMLGCSSSYNHLRCYEDSIIGFHNFNNAPSCNYVGMVDVKEVDPFKLTIVPNPVSSSMEIRIDYNESVDYLITNTIGQEIKAGVMGNQTERLDCRNLNNGVYILHLRSGNQIDNRKFVVQH